VKKIMAERQLSTSEMERLQLSLICFTDGRVFTEILGVKKCIIKIGVAKGGGETQ
jgi:hypothetical protein